MLIYNYFFFIWLIKSIIGIRNLIKKKYVYYTKQVDKINLDFYFYQTEHFLTLLFFGLHLKAL